MCGLHVVCGKCGNNSCNGGYGLNGKCDVCPSAYDKQQNEDPPASFTEKYKAKCVKESRDLLEDLLLLNI